MSHRRPGRSIAVYVGPLVCAAAALLALLWSCGLQTEATSEDAQDALIESVSELVADVEPDTTGEVTAASFLEALSEGAEQEGGSAQPVCVSWEEEADLVALATDVLEAYGGLDGASLATSGYLDLQGNAWGAVVRGGTSWVDIVFVTTQDDETSCASVVRLLPGALDGSA